MKRLAWLVSLAGMLIVPALSFAIPQPQTYGNIVYLTGGFGIDEREAIRDVAKAYNLHLAFTTGKEGTYVASVAVAVVDKHGNTVLQESEAGPWMLAQLPPGTYHINVDWEGKPQRRTVSIADSAQRHLIFHWPQ